MNMNCNVMAFQHPRGNGKWMKAPEGALWHSGSHSECKGFILHFTCSHTGPPVPHVILTLNIIREAENMVLNQWQKVTDTQQHRPVIGQRFCGGNPLSTVVNLLHCRLLSPDTTDCTPRALQSPVKYCCLSGTSQLQFSSFCLAKISYDARHIVGYDCFFIIYYY